MSEKIDVSKETRVDWDREVKAGNLVPKTPLAKPRDEGYHLMGVPLTDADAREGATLGQPEGKRIVPGHVMKHVAETGRYPSTKGTIFGGAPRGGWPVFDKDGNVVEDES